jgi:hypothetical protein
MRILGSIVAPSAAVMAARDAEIIGCCAIRSEVVGDQPVRDKAIFLQKLAHQFQRRLLVEDRRASDMTRRWFKFISDGPEEEFGFGTEEEAFDYAAILNSECDGEPCKPILLNEAQAAGLVVLVTPNTFVIADALAVMRDGLADTPGPLPTIADCKRLGMTGLRIGRSILRSREASRV